MNYGMRHLAKRVKRSDEELKRFMQEDSTDSALFILNFERGKRLSSDAMVQVWDYFRTGDDYIFDPLFFTDGPRTQLCKNSLQRVEMIRASLLRFLPICQTA